MKTTIFAGLLIIFASGFASSCRAATWPPSCGSQSATFDVKTEKRHLPPAAPTQGKAEIVFLENENQMIGPFMYATVRFGVDGAWAGADKGTSYFSIDVAPGVHHLCASWQSDLHQLNKNLDLTSFTAAPDTIYYFSAHVRVVSKDEVEFGIRQLNPDLAKYRISGSKLAESHLK